MPISAHPACLEPEKLLRGCRVTRTRRSGPGGQNRNKVETAVVIEHLASGIVAEANERRSQDENFQEAVFRLRLKLAVDVRRPAREGETPSALWRSRTPRGGRVAVNPGHADFPALLAEAMAFLEAASLDVKEAAERLGCSASQLTKFLKLEPRALGAVNAHRKGLGLRPLK